MPRDPIADREKIQSDLKKYLRKQENEEIDVIFKKYRVPISEIYREKVARSLKDKFCCNVREDEKGCDTYIYECLRCPFSHENNSTNTPCGSIVDCDIFFSKVNKLKRFFERYIERLDDMKAEDKENRIDFLIDKFFSDIGMVNSKRNKDELRRMIDEVVKESMAQILEENTKGDDDGSKTKNDN